MNDFGSTLVSVLKNLKTENYWQHYFTVFKNVIEFTDNIDNKVDYQDIVIKQFILDIGVLDKVNIEKITIETINKLDKNLLEVLKDCVNAVICDRNIQIIDFSKKHHILVFEILIIRTLSWLGENYVKCFKEFTNYLQSHHIYGGIFKKEALVYFFNESRCSEIFRILENFKYKKVEFQRQDYRLSSIGNIQPIPSVLLPQNEIIQKHTIDIIIEQPENNPVKKEPKPKKELKKDSERGIKFVFNKISKEDLSLFNLKGLKELCDRIGIKNIPKMQRDEFEEFILDYQLEDQTYQV